MALDENVEVFVVHVSSLRLSIYLAKKTGLALLLAEKLTVPAEYADFADVFLEKSASIFQYETEANSYTIKLE